MSDYKVGDEVQIHASRREERGVIEKVGRTLVHIRWGRRLETFRLSDQRWTGHQTGTGTYFTTPAQEQAKREDREREAYAALSRHGVALAFTRKYTLAQVEALAEVVKGWED
jgi:hypothetical protein